MSAIVSMSPTGMSVTEAHDVPEFTGNAGQALQLYYRRLLVETKGPIEKIAALEAHIGRFEFSAYGGGETELMRLRAAERVYLFQEGIEI